MKGALNIVKAALEAGAEVMKTKNEANVSDDFTFTVFSDVGR